MRPTNVARFGAVLAVVVCAYGSSLMAQKAPSRYEVGGELGAWAVAAAG